MKIKPTFARAATAVLATVVIAGAACDPSDRPNGDPDRSPAADAQLPPAGLAVWGCDRAIRQLPEHPDADWLAGSTMVGDFGFGVDSGDFVVWRPHRDADFQFKLPIFIQGRSGATIWIPDGQRDRVGLTLAFDPRTGPRNSHRVEDGRVGARFEPCPRKAWTAWTGGLALADLREIVLMVKVDTAERPERIVLGPWERDLGSRPTRCDRQVNVKGAQ